ncbi:phosphoribosyltransferase [soil metagenome]|jgi:hypoxanthine phosphoribosyltransferase
MPPLVSPPFGVPGAGSSEVLELSWELFGELCRVLALRVARDYQPEIIIGIAKAGVIPAATIASILRADLYTMKISRRSGGELVSEQPQVLTAAPVQAAGRRVLVVDEISSSGDTLRLALAAVRSVGPADVRTATAFARPGGFRPDYHALETDALIVFPWDRKVLEDGELVVHPAYRGVVEA